ncbi:MAG: cytochrome P450 [bacterium]|nr:cytochrome P450 [bacterium]
MEGFADFYSTTPYMSPAPFQGRLPIESAELVDFAHDPLPFMRRLYDRHGSIAAVEDQGMRFYFIFGPELNRQVLSDAKTFHSYFFPIRGPKKSAQRRLTSGLLSMNGDEHRRHRRLVMDPFSRRRFAAYLRPIAQQAEDMVARWKPGDCIDMQVEMNRYMLHVTSTLLFGFDQSERALRLGSLLDEWVNMNQEVGIAAAVPDNESSDQYESLLKFGETLESEIRDLIQMRRSQKSEGGDVLSLLLKSQDEDGGLSDDQLIGHTALMFAAAHMTTAHSLTWTLYLLAQHPEIADSLAAELNGENDYQQIISATDSQLAHVLKESLRILPGSAYVQRINVEPVKLGPFDVSRGSVIVFSQFMTHHMSELYDSPESFVPDRWKTITPSPYAYLPFGAGPRLCLGGPLATIIMRITLPAIMRRFRFKVSPGSEVNARAISTMLSPVDGVPMTLLPLDAPFERVEVTGNINNYVDLSAGA